MAIFKQKYNIGDYVYESYKPLNPGKVIRTISDTTHTEEDPSIQGGITFHENILEVKFLNGETKLINTMHLADFQELIDDHKKKLQTHLNNKAKLDNG